jgi:hypothetical protein
LVWPLVIAFILCCSCNWSSSFSFFSEGSVTTWMLHCYGVFPTSIPWAIF